MGNRISLTRDTRYLGNSGIQSGVPGMGLHVKLRIT
nr:MAG TPA: F-box/WD repeat protein [Caudoviricetes sp.]